VYFVLALGLFEHLGTGLVWGKLAAGLAARVPQPSEKALRDLRRRVGVAPFKRLFDVLAGPLAQPSTPGVRYRRWRAVAFDGCGSLSVPDHERNRSWLGRTERRYGPTGHPRLMLMTLCETGTRGLIAAVFGPASKGETDYVHDLTGHLTPDMLLLADRAFDSNDLLADIAAQGTQFLIRATSTRRPPVLALLPDGSYLTRIGGFPLRVIEAEIHSRTADGGDFGGTSRYNIGNRDGLPRASTPITAIEITVHPPALPSTQDPSRALSGRWGQVCQLLAANSNQAMHTRDIAWHLGLPSSGRPLSSLTAQLCYWARNDRLTAPRQAPTRSLSLKP
jgi:hypothetical protein